MYPEPAVEIDPVSPTTVIVAVAATNPVSPVFAAPISGTVA